MPRSKVVVLSSGGMDSTTLLYHMTEYGFDVHALSIYYGQRHKRELEAARKIAKDRQIPHTEVDLSCLISVLKKSSQTDPDYDVPSGHYEDEVMRVTVVPNRNMILLAVAAAAAISNDAKWIAYAAHAGDHAIYPDCRPEFAQALTKVLQLCHYDEGVALYTPFIHMTKADIVKRGFELEVPFRDTYSCYRGELLHCGHCGTCQERIIAFAEAGLEDPTSYSDIDFAHNLRQSHLV